MTSPSEQRILAFDPGTKFIGWVLLVNGVVEDHNTISLSKTGKRAYDRLPAAYLELKSVFDLQRPTRVGYEGLAHGGELMTIVTHAAIHALIELFSRWLFIVPMQVAPTQVKMRMTGIGGGPRSKKNYVIEAAIPYFLPALPTEHEADALGVGLFVYDRLLDIPLPVPARKRKVSKDIAA